MFANNAQILVLSSLLLARWYGVVFKCSCGWVTLVKLTFSVVHTHSVGDSLSFRFSPDWVCNTAGVQEVLSQVQFAQSAEFNSKPLIPYTIGGVQYGVFKTAGTLSFLNVFESGHQLPAYQPFLSLQAFMQIMSQQPLSSS